MRDTDRVQCYAVETEVFRGLLLNERPGFEALIAQTREVEATDEWRDLYGSEPLVVGLSHSNSSFAGYRGVFYHERADRGTVLHELAHVVTDDRHGPLWRSRFVWLVRLSYGYEWANALADAYRRANLPVDLIPVPDHRPPLWAPELFIAEQGSRFPKPQLLVTSRLGGPISL